MDNLNKFQREFLKVLTEIQERRVQIALCSNDSTSTYVII